MNVRGFTLIQFIILLSLIAIMAASLLPRMPSVNFFQTYGFSSVLAYDLNLTKVLSMSQNQRYRIVIGASSYQIEDQNGVAINHPGNNSAMIAYPTGVSVTPTTTLIFDSLGQPYASDGAALTTAFNLTVSTSGVNQVVTINPQTGLIQ